MENHKKLHMGGQKSWIFLISDYSWGAVTWQDLNLEERQTRVSLLVPVADLLHSWCLVVPTIKVFTQVKVFGLYTFHIAWNLLEDHRLTTNPWGSPRLPNCWAKKPSKKSQNQNQPNQTKPNKQTHYKTPNQNKQKTHQGNKFLSNRVEKKLNLFFSRKEKFCPENGKNPDLMSLVTLLAAERRSCQ